MPAREVRFERLKGREAMRRLAERPVVFLPIGCLERHGDHLPMGLDVLKAQSVCEACARRLGGLVYPPHFYGGVHVWPGERPPDELAERRRLFRRMSREWGNLYTHDTAADHLVEVAEGIRLAGARVLVLYSGHYPVSQIMMLKDVAGRLDRARGGTMRVIPFLERDFFEDGDHAGVWETSLCLALRPGDADMRRIGPRNQRDHGWDEAHHPRRASAAFGRRVLRRIADHLGESIQAALAASDSATKKD